MEDKIITCPLCGNRFNREEVKQTCKKLCSKDCGACDLLSCPNCGHKIVEESGLFKKLKSMFTFDKKKDSGD